jgi:uncharacterized protein (DUF885 family)
MLWQSALNTLHGPPVGPAGRAAVYREEIDRLARHCLENGFVTEELLDSCPVSVLPVPRYLTAIRTASSYSIAPGYPPRGGVFYLLGAETNAVTAHREMRMLCAHETYPGHHLLDSSRWNVRSELFRVAEFPLFYEGWACFAEELMRRTGYFSDPASGLLLARRRFWRAIRGKIDIGLQNRTLDLASASSMLTDVGIDHKRAAAIVRRYTLNPGYQVCYTFGLRRFIDLFDRFGCADPQKFVKTVLESGELGFQELTAVLQQSIDEDNSAG